MSPLDRNRLWSRLAGAVAAHPEPLPTPLMVVDLDAFDANADDLARRAAGTPIRVASKSVRVPDLVARALAHPGFEGVLSYTVAEALWLAEAGISDDIVVAYPSVDRGALARLLASSAATERITLMVDAVEHLDVVDAVRGSASSEVRVALGDGWTVEVPGSFADGWDADGRTWVGWDERRRLTIRPGGGAESFAPGFTEARDEAGRPVWRLAGVAQANGCEPLAYRIDLADLADRDWAETVWRSLRHTPSAASSSVA